MIAHESGRSLHGIAPWRRGVGLATVGMAVVLGLTGRVDAAHPDPSGPGERFESARFGYALTLPAGWQVVDGALTYDLSMSAVDQPSVRLQLTGSLHRQP